jgi:hypothetical protein
MEFSAISILGKNAQTISDFTGHPILPGGSDQATPPGTGSLPVYSGQEIRFFGEVINKILGHEKLFFFEVQILLNYINRPFIGLFVFFRQPVGK